MNVSLTRGLEDFVNRKVSPGRYGSASEVVREALRLLEDKDRVREAQLGELRAEIAKGVEQLDRSGGLSGRVKSGHTWTGQNRPTGVRVETVRFYPAVS